MLTAIVFIITLAILIFVHELGHFLVAKRNGIKADEFGFGFPPRIFGYVREGKKWKFIRGNKEVEAKNTIYSLNWIPLGGFVKIKGENGDVKDKDSFSSKSAWTRIRVLAAGVTMNFVLAWFIITIAFMIGIPQAVDSANPAKGSVIQISQVIQGSPAEKMGIMPGDQIVKCEMPENPLCKNNFTGISQVQDLINASKGKEITLEIKRGSEILHFNGTPRLDYPADQGPLGVALAQTAIVSYPWYQATYEGLKMTINIVVLIVTTFYDIIRSLLIGQKVSVDISGPIGIAYVAKQFTDLGFVYILQFIALLSINLGIINILPFPALDGGRILFILIEKVKGSPVSQKVEQMIHNFGFVFLILLMLLVTFNDIIRFGIIDKIKGIF